MIVDEWLDSEVVEFEVDSLETASLSCIYNDSSTLKEDCTAVNSQGGNTRGTSGRQSAAEGKIIWTERSGDSDTKVDLIRKGFAVNANKQK